MHLRGQLPLLDCKHTMNRQAREEGIGWESGGGQERIERKHMGRSAEGGGLVFAPTEDRMYLIASRKANSF